MFWVNGNLPYIIDTPITEYDIKSGNVSIMRTFKDQFDPPLNLEQIDQIANLDKSARVIRVGNMMRDIPKFSETLEKGFNTIVVEFCKENNLDTSESSEDIVSIKRDAVFVVGKEVYHTVIGEYCHFIPKNVYDGYMRIKGYEFYIDFQHQKVDVKGMQDQLLPLHKEGILNLILALYDECVKTGMDRTKISRWFADLCDAYLSRDLPFPYYRQFDEESKYRIQMGEMDYLTEDIDEEDLQDLNIEFNYKRILIPLLNLFI